jgi:hypothetical protein
VEGSGYARIVNDVVHDVTSGTWAACLLVIWLLASRMGEMPAEAAAAISDTMWLLFWLLLASLVLVLVTGALRLRFWRIAATPDEVSVRRRAAVVRHVVYLVVYGGGTLWAWALVR